MRRVVLLGLILAGTGCNDGAPAGPSGAAMRFFVTSTTSITGDLGGLAGADVTCQRLATAAGFGGRTTWRAYLSVEHDQTNGNRPTHARDRIGLGPWFNANGLLVAESIAQLHARSGDADVFVDEYGRKINGQWSGSPGPTEHDILTGSNADGTLAPGMTCEDWTSRSAASAAQVGHSDGLGPNQSATGALASWNSAHANQSCANTAPRGGAGRFYCFAR